MTEKLNFRKLCKGRDLNSTENHKKKGLVCPLDFMMHSDEEEDNILRQIITRDDRGY